MQSLHRINGAAWCRQLRLRAPALVAAQSQPELSRCSSMCSKKVRKFFCIALSGSLHASHMHTACVAPSNYVLTGSAALLERHHHSYMKCNLARNLQDIKAIARL